MAPRTQIVYELCSNEPGAADYHDLHCVFFPTPPAAESALSNPDPARQYPSTLQLCDALPRTARVPNQLRDQIRLTNTFCITKTSEPAGLEPSSASVLPRGSPA